jgi:hypothetical protein
MMTGLNAEYAGAAAKAFDDGSEVKATGVHAFQEGPLDPCVFRSVDLLDLTIIVMPMRESDRAAESLALKIPGAYSPRVDAVAAE